MTTNELSRPVEILLVEDGPGYVRSNREALLDGNVWDNFNDADLDQLPNVFKAIESVGLYIVKLPASVGRVSGALYP